MRRIQHPRLIGGIVLAIGALLGLLVGTARLYRSAGAAIGNPAADLPGLQSQALIACALAAVAVVIFVPGLIWVLCSLNRIQRAISQRSRIDVINMLSAGVIHEIKTPLATIAASGQLLQKSLADQPDELELANFITDEAKRIAEVTETLLGRGAASEYQFIDLDEFTAAVVRQFTPSAKQKGVTVQVDMTAERKVYVAPLLLRMVLGNIIRNAIEAVAPDNGRVAITAVEIIGYVGVRVTDNGPGMTSAAARRMFEPLATTKERGSGLGLAAAYQAVEEMRGRIDVGKAADGGATFTVWLPIKRYRVGSAKLETGNLETPDS